MSRCQWQWRPCRSFALLALVVAASADPARPSLPRASRLRGAPRPELVASSVVSAGDSGWEAGAVEEGAKPKSETPAPAPAAAATSRRTSKPQLSVLEKKRAFVASLLCFFFGSFGAHHLYLGRNVAALQCLLTFNLLGFGMPLDLLSMRRYVRELTAAEAADAAALAQRGRYVPAAAVTTVGPPKAAATAAQQQEQQAAKARRVGLFGFVWLLLRFAIRSIPQFVFGRWLGTMCARTLPDGVAGGLGMAGTRGAWLHAAGAAVAVWLSVATAGRRQLSTAAQIVSFAAMGPLGLVRRRRRHLWLGTIVSQTPLSAPRLGQADSPLPLCTNQPQICRSRKCPYATPGMCAGGAGPAQLPAAWRRHALPPAGDARRQRPSAPRCVRLAAAVRAALPAERDFPPPHPTLVLTDPDPGPNLLTPLLTRIPIRLLALTLLLTRIPTRILILLPDQTPDSNQVRSGRVVPAAPLGAGGGARPRRRVSLLGDGRGRLPAAARGAGALRWPLQAPAYLPTHPSSSYSVHASARNATLYSD